MVKLKYYVEQKVRGHVQKNSCLCISLFKTNNNYSSKYNPSFSIPYASVLQAVESDLDNSATPWTQRIHGTLLRLDQKFQIIVFKKSAPLNETSHNQKEQGRDCKLDAVEPLHHRVHQASP